MIQIDPDDLFVPACPPVVPARYDPRPGDRTVVADLTKPTLRLRNQFSYDKASETLVIQCHTNPVPSDGELKHALSEIRESGQVVRRILAYCHPQTYRDSLLELDFRGYERSEQFETILGPYAGQFALLKKLKMREEKGATE